MRMSAAGGAADNGSVVRVDDLLQELEHNLPEDLSSVRRRQRDKAIVLLRDEALVEPACSFNIVDLRRDPERDRLHVGGEKLPMLALARYRE